MGGGGKVFQCLGASQRYCEAAKRQFVLLWYYHTVHVLVNAAINDVLPLKAARRYAILLTQNGFWGLGHQTPNFDGCIYIRYAAPSYSARSKIVRIGINSGSVLSSL